MKNNFINQLARILIFGLISFISTKSFCQTITAYDDSTSLTAYTILRNDDPLVIKYDTAYILNKKTYKLYNDNFLKIRNSNLATKNLMIAYENLNALQDSMLRTKEAYYQGLKANFDSVTNSTNNFVNKTEVNIRSIDNSITNATGQLNNIKESIDKSLELLKKQNKQKIKLIAGGFTVGVVVTGLIFIIAK